MYVSKKRKNIYLFEHQSKNERLAILIADKVDFTAQKISKDSGIVCNDIRVNLPRRNRNPKGMSTKEESCNICDAKTDRTEGKNRQAQLQYID